MRDIDIGRPTGDYGVIDEAGDAADAYVTVLDSDLRGTESARIIIHNSHGSNGITVDCVDVDEFSQSNSRDQFPLNLTAGQYGKIQLEKAEFQNQIKVKRQNSGQAATWEIKGTINTLGG